MKSDFERPYEISFKVTYVRKLIVEAETSKEAYSKLVVELNSLDEDSRPISMECLSCSEVV